MILLLFLTSTHRPPVPVSPPKPYQLPPFFFDDGRLGSRCSTLDRDINRVVCVRRAKLFPLF